jgi:hypothetical protein
VRAITTIALLALLGCRSKTEVDDTGAAPGDTAPVVVDADEDGFTEDEDCDDHDASIFPGADEVCNGVDDDCDLEVDEDALDALTWYPDVDLDGFGDLGDDGTVACEAPSGSVEDHTDCDDTDAATHPGADEWCDGVDRDCDGTVDDDAIDASAWFADGDGDGYGDAAVSVSRCAGGDGWVSDDSDCDDGDPAIHPGAEERCNGVDDNCDGTVDEDHVVVDGSTWYEDRDGDGYGDASTAWVSCFGHSDAVLDSSDCDDSDAAVYPGAEERCNGVDDNCDGTVDEDHVVVDGSTWYEDRDGDGYGDASTAWVSCFGHSDAVLDGTDCDDTDAAVYPGADEHCNGVDDDCDGDIDEDHALDTIDQYHDRDGDGYGGALAGSWCELVSAYVLDHSDCDDYDADTYPGADEHCDGIDRDCNGVIDDDYAVDATTWYADFDEDSYGDAGNSITTCLLADPYVLDTTDCDDTDPDVSPGADELCNGVDDDCDGVVDQDSAVGGDAAGCAAESCAAILAARPGLASGSYWIELPSAGAVAELACEMVIDGGGWTQASEDFLVELGTGPWEYLYSHGSAWYLSPSTDLLWDWSSFQALEGAYYYSTGSEWAEGSFDCSDVEAGHYGVGCSNGPGGQWKVLPWGAGQDAAAATGPICQDQPDVFAVGSCASGVSVWVR